MPLWSSKSTEPEAEGPEPLSRWRKGLVACAVMSLLALVLAGGGLVLFGYMKFNEAGPLEAERVFEIRRGEGMGAVASRLERDGLISSADLFRIGARYRGMSERIKYGEFMIPARASMSGILDIVVEGRTITYRVTVPEGWTSWQVARLLNGADNLSGSVDERPPEGSVAPNTYTYSKNEDRGAVLGRMMRAQSAILQEAWNGRAEGLPLGSPEEALILASIVEKETGINSERDIVASVFINRLSRGMKLDTDPTVIYGLTGGEEPLGRGLRRSELRKETPYNTYLIKGLPPTPIANPGRAAIEAVLNPADTEFLFFVADGTGGHAFAKTLSEHNRNVRKWRKIEAERKQSN